MPIASSRMGLLPQQTIRLRCGPQVMAMHDARYEYGWPSYLRGMPEFANRSAPGGWYRRDHTKFGTSQALSKGGEKDQSLRGLRGSKSPMRARHESLSLSLGHDHAEGEGRVREGSSVLCLCMATRTSPAPRMGSGRAPKPSSSFRLLLCLSVVFEILLLSSPVRPLFLTNPNA